MQAKRPRSLKDHEDLTYHDLWRRIKTGFPGIDKIPAYPGIIFKIWSEWREQRAYFFELYRRIDIGKSGKYNRVKDMKSMKKAVKEYKEKVR
jgi:hypothetical protein